MSKYTSFSSLCSTPGEKVEIWFCDKSKWVVDIGISFGTEVIFKLEQSAHNWSGTEYFVMQMPANTILSADKHNKIMCTNTEVISTCSVPR